MKTCRTCQGEQTIPTADGRVIDCPTCDGTGFQLPREPALHPYLQGMLDGLLSMPLDQKLKAMTHLNGILVCSQRKSDATMCQLAAMGLVEVFQSNGIHVDLDTRSEPRPRAQEVNHGPVS